MGLEASSGTPTHHMGLDQAKVVKVLVVFLLVFSFGLCIASFFSARQCYVTPCYVGQGLDMMWSVDGGKSFQIVATALVCFAHVFGAYWILFKSTYDDLTYGVLVACTLSLSVVLMTQAVFWGQQGLMISELQQHSTVGFFEHTEACLHNGNRTMCQQVAGCAWTAFHTCQRHMVADKSAQARFNSVTAFSVLLALTQALFGYLLLSWQAEFKDVFGASKVQKQPFRPQPQKAKAAAVPAPVHTEDHGFGDEAPEPTSYQDGL
eukprot:c20366_g1_i1.p2 GENE.c20366_g1_i1~~c20366_g1_i1.p2  ORF type:complete len:263 (+),score=68.41 c20366_g1_i1:3-791(+)